ncbi:hypothetical protein [Agromyces sp. NPDC057865]|uniref:hypothetical protein n=1 Tax=Agromyces sp. NPDC057865 TaxID=3346267 RepID=UPI003672F2E1
MAGAAFVLFLAFGVGILIWFLALDGDVGVIWGVPMPGIVMMVLGGAGIVFLIALPLALPHERRAAREYGAPVYRIGTTPWGRSMLVIGNTALVAMKRDGDSLGRWAIEDVDVVILSPAASALSIVIAAQDQFFEIPLVLRANGPAAPAWSWDTLSGRHALERSLRGDLTERGYAVAMAPA